VRGGKKMDSGTIIIIMLLSVISLQLGKLTVKVTADKGEYMKNITEIENALNRINRLMGL
jgi:hypothetical protein